MASPFSLSLYINGAPTLFQVLEPFKYKQVLDLNEQSFSLVNQLQQFKQKIFTLPDDSGVLVIVENLLYKKGGTNNAFLILLFESLHYNPFTFGDHYITPVIELLKFVTGGKSLSLCTPDAIVKGASKYKHELESSLSDLLIGVDMTSGKNVKGAVQFPRFMKKQTDFFEVKYADIEQRFIRQIDGVKEAEVRERKLKPARKIIIEKLLMEDDDAEEVKIPVQQQQAVERVISPAKSKKQEPPVTSGTVIEKLEMVMENQQICSATLTGIATLSQQDCQLQIMIEDPRWSDKTKFQINVNPIANDGQQGYVCNIGKEPVNILQYRANPQLLSELPILIMWTNTQQKQGLQQQTVQISPDDLKYMYSNPDYARVDQDECPLRVTFGNLRKQQGVVEFMCSEAVKILRVQMELRDKLITDLQKVECVDVLTKSIRKLEFRTDINIKIANQTVNQFA